MEMSDYNAKSMPLSTSGTYWLLFKPINNVEYEQTKGKPFQEILGVINYLTIIMHPNILYVVQTLGLFSHYSGTYH